MKKPTKIFLVGLAAAGLVWAAGVVNTHRLERREAEFQTKCVAETLADHVTQALANPQLLASLSDTELAALAKRKASDVSDLVEQRDKMRKQYQSEHAATGPADDLIPPAAIDVHSIMWDRFICDAKAVSGRSDLVGLEADIANAHQAMVSSETWPIPCSSDCGRHRCCALALVLPAPATCRGRGCDIWKAPLMTSFPAMPV
jgi:hypothetical protein